MNRRPNTIGLARLHREATGAGTKKQRRFKDRGSPARGRFVETPTELHVPYRWCSNDDCPCYLPECAEHGCMDR